MAHVRFGGLAYNFPDDRLQEITESIESGLRDGTLVRLSLPDEDGEVSTLFITSGCAVVVNEWTVEPVTMPAPHVPFY